MAPRIFAAAAFAVLLAVAPVLSAQTGTGENDSRVEDLYGEAKAAQSRGDVAGAIAKYEEILRIAPKLGAAYNNLGALYFRQRDFRQAAAVLERGLKMDPAMASALALLGISYYEMGDAARARSRLEGVLRANPKDANARMYLVKSLMKLNEYEAAGAQLRQLAADQPKNQEVWYLLAKVYMKLSEGAMAKINLIDANSVLAHELSAEMMEAMNNYDGAVVELTKAVEMGPRQAGTHYKLGDAYWSMSQWDLAAAQFRAELEVDPGNCMAQEKLGNILLQQSGSAGEALAAVDKALAMCPAMVEGRVDRGRALMSLNRNAEAVKDLEAAVKADPTDARTHFLLAKAYRGAGRAQEAQAEMQAFSKLEERARAATAERAKEVIRNKENAH